MPCEMIPQKIVDAILRTAGPSIADMDMAAHPAGPGYCVYDDKGNVAVFDYDPAADQATLRYSTIPGIDNLSRDRQSSSSAPSASFGGSLIPAFSDLGWKDIRSQVCGFLPGLLVALGGVCLFAGVVLAALMVNIHYFFIFLSFSVVIFWLFGVLNSLRNIERHLYCLHYPDWIQCRNSKTPGE